MAHILLDDLVQARRAAGWSRATLAMRIGVTAQAIKRLEAGVGSVATLTAAMRAVDFQLVGIGPGATLHAQLRDRRRKLGLSLDQVATRTSMSRATVASLENGGGSVRSLLRLLAVIAPRARRGAPERVYWGQADKVGRDSRFTPPEFMEPVYEALGDIDLDPCAHPVSPVVARRRIILAEGGNGLTEE